MNDELIGKRLGPYHIAEAISRGGMSMVYKAYQESLGRSVAVKVLRYGHDPQFTERFAREARTIAQLQHPNILPIYDYGEQNGLIYLVLQYVERGATLADMLGAPMEPATALRLISHVLDALGYAHDRGIIHRDIKPANILMLTPTWPMLADFGIAKLMDNNQPQLTAPGLIIGTAAYMAPEQATGAPIDMRTDLYSTGVVLYEMLTGQVPFDADMPVVVLTKQAYEQPPRPRSINPSLSEAVEAMLLRALEKSPAARYQTAAAMVGDLARLAAQIEQSGPQGQAAELYYKGVQAFETGRWDDAIDRFSRLVELAPGYEDATELLEAARSAQEQARIKGRQQLDYVRQRRESTVQPQVDAPPQSRPGTGPTPVLDSTIQMPPKTERTTRETRRFEPAVAPLNSLPPPPSATADLPGSASPPTDGISSPVTTPAQRRYALWALGAVALIAVIVLVLSRVGALPSPEPTAGVPTTAPAEPTEAPAANPSAVAPTSAPVPASPPATNPPAQATQTVSEPPPPVAGPLVYTDDFGADPETEKEKSGLENEQQAQDFSRGFHSPGVYHFKLPRPNETHWEVLPRFAYRNFTVQVELWDNSDTFSGDVAQGLLLRVRDDAHFYMLLIDPRQGRYTVRKHDGTAQPADLIPWTASPLIKSQNQHNLLRVDAADDHFTIYLNDAALGSFQDGAYTFGMVGMVVENADAVTPHMHFDNLKIWSADTPPSNAALPPRPDMAPIPGGEFVIGGHQRDDQQPPHIVGVKAFYIDQTEVTNAAYARCVAAGRCTEPVKVASYAHPTYSTDATYANYPVINVTWEQARDYCAWADKRLPSEAEWEKAASWNATAQHKTIWPWEGGFDITLLNTDVHYGDTTAVKKFPAELNGTYDMAGNVWEWTSSLYKPYPYDAADGREDLKAIGQRVFRGGSWAQSPGTRATFRDHAAQTDSNNETGFRCAATP